MISEPIVLEFQQAVSGRVVIDSTPFFTAEGELKVDEKVHTIYFDKDEQIVACIIDITPTTIDIEIKETEKGNLGMGLMFNVPRRFLKPTPKPNFNIDEE